MIMTLIYEDGCENVGAARNSKNFTIRVKSFFPHFFQSLVSIETVGLMRSIEDVILIHNCKPKVTPAQVFFCGFCEIFKNSSSVEHLQMVAFVHNYPLLKHFPRKI